MTRNLHRSIERARKVTSGVGPFVDSLTLWDFAGIIVVMTIFTSSVVAGYAAIDRLFHPQPVSNIWAVAIGAIIGGIGNEAVACFRIRVGIGRPARRHENVDFVLDRFSKREWRELDVLIEDAADAVLSIIDDGLEATQNHFNRGGIAP